MNRLSWSLLALLTLLPTAARAVPGDVDDDGISDAADAFPNDWRRSGISYVPAENQFSTLLFEDNWPAKGDLDFNDAVVSYNIAAFHGIDGRVSGLRLTVVPRAIGANFSSGLALRLPIPAGTAFTGTRQIGAGAPEAIQADAGESQLVLTVVDALRPLFGDAPGFINTDLALPASANGQSVIVELFFGQPLEGLNIQNDPFDLYFFRSGDPSYQVHRPEFGGTDRMNGALFGTGDDASTDARHFVDRQGLPFVLSIPDAAAWPAEHQRVDQAWPNIIDFAESNGVNGADYWRTNAGLQQLFTGGSPVSVPGVDFGFSFAPSCTDGVRNGGEADADCGGPCGACANGLACRTHADCDGQVCSGNACVQADVRSCAVANGMGQETRGAGGWSACAATSCNAGFAISNGACAQGCAAHELLVNGVCTWNTGGAGCQNSGGTYDPASGCSCPSTHIDVGDYCIDARNDGSIASLRARCFDSGGRWSRSGGEYHGCDCPDLPFLDLGWDVCFCLGIWNASARTCTYPTVSCGAGTHDESGVCVSDTRACPVANGSGTQTWNGGWSGCSVTSCGPNYRLSNGACEFEWEGTPCGITSGYGVFVHDPSQPFSRRCQITSCWPYMQPDPTGHECHLPNGCPAFTNPTGDSRVCDDCRAQVTQGYTGQWEDGSNICSCWDGGCACCGPGGWFGF